ncbi:unnamed protein product [Somion occarium]|uniref:Choline kinase n=1 Tax=Somion occarium TaxID=3059160 RepID=A0ABP1CNW7_9APHY
MAPTIGPELPSLHPVSSRGRNALTLRRTVPKVSLETREDTFAARSSSRSSTASIQFDETAGDVVRVEGLKHSDERLDARRYKSAAFAEQLSSILHTLCLPFWTGVSASAMKIEKVSGSLTNAVFFVSCPSTPSIPILLLRIYGPSSGSMISRPRELQILHVLSSQYHIGPRVYGTFENGRIEEYFDSAPLTPADMRDPQVSSWIGARMAELHQVDIDTVEGSPEAPWEVGAKKNVRAWLLPAKEVLSLPSVSDAIRKDLDLDRFQAEWEGYIRWLDEKEQQVGTSRRVFAHNDTQYGNLLRLNSPKPGIPEHRQIIVVDFEYASPNPAAFDIANHFHEWTANYHSDTPHLLDPKTYPTLEQRYNFYRAYIKHYGTSITSDDEVSGSLDDQMTTLDRQVQLWSPASHAQWAVWGVVQARESLEAKDGEPPEFDYIGYARCRMEGFRRELRALMS